MTTRRSHTGAGGATFSDIRDTRSPDYEDRRIEGWILPPSEYGELALGPTFGFDRRPVRRRLNTLVILEAFSDTPFPVPAATIAQRFFGPGRPSVDGILRTVSGGRVSLNQIGVVPITQPYPLADVLDGGAQAASAHVNAIRRTDPLFDFRRLDKNGDNFLAKDEALIIKMLSNPTCACGQQLNAPSLTLDGVNISGAGFATICQLAHWHVLSEEIAHTFGFVDLYGLNASLNIRASFMGDNCGTDINSSVGPFLLDPWHRMTAGWMQPRPFPISRAAGSVVINSTDRVFPGSLLTRNPVLLYDPRRSFDEYFILQHRSPVSPSGLDTGAIGEGLAVWYTNVHDRNPLKLESFDWPPPLTETDSVTGDSFAHYYIASDGSAGSGPFLGAGDQANLSWGNGANTGLTVHVQRTSAGEPR